MPCYQINTISVVFKAKNKDVLEQTLKDLNFSFHTIDNVVTVLATNIVINLNTEEVKCRDYEFGEVNEIRRKYTENSIYKIAAAKKKKGWFLKKTAQNKLQLRRV
jgi:hypothetical protein